MYKFSLLLILMLSMAANGQHQASDAEGVCYLPTQSNVAYSTLADLSVDSPNEVLPYGNDPLQFGELWLPLGGSEVGSVKPHPLVILIHGGCWLNAFDIRHTHALSTALAQSGYAVWSIEYRRIGDKGGGWPGSYDDIKSAIAYVPNLAKYPVDLDKVAIAGHSAGGHLALLAGTDQLYNFSAVIGLAAIVDLEKYSQGSSSCQTATAKFIGGSIAELPEVYRQANPARRNLHPSTVLLHGLADSIVAPEHAQTSAARSRLIEQGGHFDMVHPGTLSFRVLLQELAKAFAEKG